MRVDVSQPLRLSIRSFGVAAEWRIYLTRGDAKKHFSGETQDQIPDELILPPALLENEPTLQVFVYYFGGHEDTDYRLEVEASQGSQTTRQEKRGQAKKNRVTTVEVDLGELTAHA